MDRSTHEIRIEHWKEVVRLCQSRPDGHTAKDWLASNGISIGSIKLELSNSLSPELLTVILKEVNQYSYAIFN